MIEVFDSGKDVCEEKLLQSSLERANCLHRNVPTTLPGIPNETHWYEVILSWTLTNDY